MLCPPTYLLLVSDVSVLAAPSDLEGLFECFGLVRGVEMNEIFNSEGHSLQATVFLATFEGAELARMHLNGYSLLGRNLKVAWLHRPVIRNPNAGGVVNSIYVRHCTPDVFRVVSRDEIVRIFRVFGLIETVIMKPSFFDQRTNMQCGYCFVHFTSKKEGVEAALRAAQVANNTMALGLGLQVELSRQLVRQLEGTKLQQGTGLAPRAFLPATSDLAVNGAFPTKMQSWGLSVPSRLAAEQRDDTLHKQRQHKRLDHTSGPLDCGGSMNWGPTAPGVSAHQPLLEFDILARHPQRSLLDLSSEQARSPSSSTLCHPHFSFYGF